MRSLDATFVVAFVLAAGVPADALAPAAETLRGFGFSAVDTPIGRDAAGWQALAREQAWRAVIVASPDGTLPAALASALAVPVIRVPTAADASRGGLALLQNAEGDLPAAREEGAAFATVAIGPAGAKNAALFVVAVLALEDAPLRAAWEAYRQAQTDAVLRLPPPTLADPSGGHT